MDTDALDYVDLEGQPLLAGRLWARTAKVAAVPASSTTRSGCSAPTVSRWSPPCSSALGRFTRPSDKPIFGTPGDSGPDR